MPSCRAVPHPYRDVGCKILTDVLAHAAQQAVATSGPTASLHSPAWTLTGPPGVSSDPRSSGWEALFDSPSPGAAGMAALKPAPQGRNPSHVFVCPPTQPGSVS